MPLNTGYLTAKTDKASDEYYTPEEAVIPLLEYLHPDSIIWCPFDKGNSSYVKVLKENGLLLNIATLTKGRISFIMNQTIMM